MTGRWWDKEGDRWDTEEIRRCFEPHRGWLAQSGAKLMMCAPYDWPASVRGEAENGKYVAPDRLDAAAKNFRDLVTILVDDLKLPVTHWELTNEWDNAYEKLDKLPELWAVVNRLADEARSASPGTRVGGPALTWPKPVWVEGLLDDAGPKLDFVTWHGYAAGEPTTPNDALIERAGKMGEQAQYVQEELDERDLEDVETYKTEFNVQWTWRPYERRHANSVGAAFLVATVDELARAGVDGASVWHAMGDSYGLVDGQGRRRATGQLYLWANRYAHGQAMAASGAMPDGLTVVPIRLAGRRAGRCSWRTKPTARSGSGPVPPRCWATRRAFVA